MSSLIEKLNQYEGYFAPQTSQALSIVVARVKLYLQEPDGAYHATTVPIPPELFSIYCDDPRRLPKYYSVLFRIGSWEIVFRDGQRVRNAVIQIIDPERPKDSLVGYKAIAVEQRGTLVTCALPAKMELMDNRDPF